MSIKYGNGLNGNECRANELNEKSFYPPADERLHDIGIDDISSEYTYDDYLSEFWELYEKELFD